MIAELSQWSLRDPWLLACLLLLPLAAWSRRRRGEPALRFAPAGLLVPLGPPTLRLRLRLLPDLLILFGIACAVVALARPVERVPLPLSVEGVDVMLCLDVSSSMAATDMDPNRTRLDVAKAAAARFVGERPRDRIGLITFARYPDLLCPTTLDHRALGELLAGVHLIEHGDDEDVTGIGTAVARAASALRTSPARSRIVVLVTDGEENVATAGSPDEIDPLEAGRLCRSFGVRVYSIVAGVGAQQQDGSFVPLDTRQVEELARDTEGRFFAARSAASIEQVYGHIDALEKVAFEEARFVFEERFATFLALGVALWLLGVLLRSTWLRVIP